MYYSLTGTLIHLEAFMAVVECGGVGYKCVTTTATLGALPKLGETATLYTHLNVREDAMDLYGFSSLRECEAFKKLIAVGGVGPKSAIAVLSDMTPDKLALCIASGDTKALCRAPGIGPKAAQRIILELKDKFAAGQVDAGVIGASEMLNDEQSAMSEAVSALCALGYGRGEAVSALAGAGDGMSSQELIKLALKKLSGAR